MKKKPGNKLRSKLSSIFGSIQSKLLFVSLILMALPVTLIFYLSQSRIHQYFTDKLENKMEFVLINTSKQMKNWHRVKQNELRVIIAGRIVSDTAPLRDAVSRIMTAPDMNSISEARRLDIIASSKEMLRGYIKDIKKRNKEYLGISVLDSSDKAVHLDRDFPVTPFYYPWIFEKGLTGFLTTSDSGARPLFVMRTPLPVNEQDSAFVYTVLDPEVLFKQITGMSELKNTRGDILAVTIRNSSGVKIFSTVQSPDDLDFIERRAVPEYGCIIECGQKRSEAYGPLNETRKWLATFISIITICSFIFLGFIIRNITDPVKKLTEAAKKIHKGESGVGIREEYEGEIGYLISVFNDMSRNLEDSRVILEEKNKILEKLAITDELTGMYNNRHYHGIMKQEANRALRSGLPLALAILDIDNFKAVNDTYGHDAGDRILMTVSKAIQKSIRNTDYAARYGGEEFSILLPDTAIEGASTVAEKVRKSVEESFYLDQESGKLIKVTVSIGLTIFRENVRKTFIRADEALYESKRNGKNRVTVN